MNNNILYIVATPIGNLKDITLRALECLRSVDVIIAEDTRVANRLLQSHGIGNVKVESVREYTTSEAICRLLKKITNDYQPANVAYIADAGTPNISDPGGRLVEEARKMDWLITPIPGASALTTLLSVCGQPISDGFLFLGFLPKKKGRQTLLKSIPSRWPVVFYERPDRLKRTLADLAGVYDSATIAVIGRELTKMFETIDIINLEQLDSYTPVTKGEAVAMIIPRKK